MNLALQARRSRGGGADEEEALKAIGEETAFNVKSQPSEWMKSCRPSELAAGYWETEKLTSHFFLSSFPPPPPPPLTDSLHHTFCQLLLTSPLIAPIHHQPPPPGRETEVMVALVVVMGWSWRMGLRQRSDIGDIILEKLSNVGGGD